MGTRDETSPAQRSQPPSSTTAVQGAEVKRVNSVDLLHNASELIIVHGAREYHLRVTSNGKLILTA